MTHQKIKTKEFEISYCDCNKTCVITLLNKKDKLITSLSIETFIKKFEKINKK